ncbi:MAG TPA: acyl carrier protein [Trueperaceae bacterium]|nr:acyl carrier protein [Trueperaceae bacterium]
MQQGIDTTRHEADRRATQAGAESARLDEEQAAVEREVRSFLTDNFILDEDASDASALPGDASLTERGVLDSMGVLELIMFIEERYGFKVPDEDTVPENLDSVDRIVGYVRAHASS